LHMAQLMPLPLTVSCFSRIQIGFTFLVPAHLGSPGQRAVKRVCVCNSNNTSSDALRPIFPNMLLNDFKNPALFFFENEHLNFVELSKYTPRYLADISHLIEWPDATISTQAFLNRGPKRIHADFPTLIAMSRNSSSEAHISYIIVKFPVNKPIY